MTRIAFFALAFLLLAVPAASADSIVDVPIINRESLTVLDRLGIDVTEDVSRERARVVLHDASEGRTLTDNGFTYTTVVPDTDAAIARAARLSRQGTQRSGLPTGRDSYRVLADYLTELKALADAHPGLVRRFVLPKRTIEDREIVGVEMAKNVNSTDDGRPTIVYFGLHHAREWPSGEVTMELAHDLAENYGTDPRITSILDTTRVVIVPVVNPDAFVVSRGEDPGAPEGEDAMRRKNCRAVTAEEESMPCVDRTGVDLNRNYGAGWGGAGASSSPSSNAYRGTGPFSEPESQSVHEFMRTRQVMHVQSTHNVVGEVLRQPGFRDYGELSPDEDIMKPLGDAMGEASGYDSLLGYELYDVHGATEDWDYIEQGAMGYTIELGPNDPTPGDQVGGVFQGPYQTHVVDQYLGGPTGGPPNKGVREAFLMAAEQAGRTSDHGVLSGVAKPGYTLRLHKDFTTDTVRICADTNDCPEESRLPVQAFPDFLDTTLTVPESGQFTWHVGPSTRPWVGAAGGTESWTITCEAPDGAVLSSLPIVVRRGERLIFENACDAGAPVQTSFAPPGGGPGGGGEPPVIPVLKPPRNMRLFVGPRRIARSALRRRHYLRVAMKVTGATVTRLRVRLVNRDRDLLASRSFKRLVSRKAVRMRLRRIPPRGVYRLSLRGIADNGAPVGSAVRLRVVGR